MLQALGIETDTWLARALVAPQLEGGVLPDLESFDEAVLARKALDGSWTVVDPRFRHAPMGYVAPLLRGAKALPLRRGLPGAALSLETVPDRPVPAFDGAPPWRGSDGRNVHLSAVVRPDGSADVTVDEQLTGWPALEWREALERLDEDRLRIEFEERTLGVEFPGAVLGTLEYGARDQDREPFRIHFTFTVPQLGRREGATLSIPSPLPSMLGRRLVQLSQRSTPLQLPVLFPAHVEATLTFTEGARPSCAPEVIARGVGAFSQRCQVEGRSLRLQRDLVLPPERVAPGAYEGFRRFVEQVDGAEARVGRVELPASGDVAPPTIDSRAGLP